MKHLMDLCVWILLALHLYGPLDTGSQIQPESDLSHIQIGIVKEIDMVTQEKTD